MNTYFTFKRVISGRQIAVIIIIYFYNRSIGSIEIRDTLCYEHNRRIKGTQSTQEPTEQMIPNSISPTRSLESKRAEEPHTPAQLCKSNVYLLVRNSLFLVVSFQCEQKKQRKTDTKQRCCTPHLVTTRRGQKRSAPSGVSPLGKWVSRSCEMSCYPADPIAQSSRTDLAEGLSRGWTMVTSSRSLKNRSEMTPGLILRPQRFKSFYSCAVKGNTPIRRQVSDSLALVSPLSHSFSFHLYVFDLFLT